MIIGITGNSGVGKTEISRILCQKINAEIINADEIVKELSKPENIYYAKIVELFGKEILEKNKINKKKLAEIIYNNKEKREELNQITYKYVTLEIEKNIKKIKEKNIIIDAPLLFESHLDKLCDFTIAILADATTKIKRIIKRDNINEKIAKSRLGIQQSDEFYVKKADFIITNNGKIDEINLEEICIKIGKS